MKTTQFIMIWFLPIIGIGGLFFPVLGYLVPIMIVFFLSLSFFKGRYWCANLCPRGSFLDIVMSKHSPKKPLPKRIAKGWFRWLIFIAAILMSFLVWIAIPKSNTLNAIGAIFVSICLVTTIASIVLGITTNHRGWCQICPMGKLQDKVSSTNKGSR